MIAKRTMLLPCTSWRAIASAASKVASVRADSSRLIVGWMSMGSSATTSCAMIAASCSRYARRRALAACARGREDSGAGPSLPAVPALSAPTASSSCVRRSATVTITVRAGSAVAAATRPGRVRMSTPSALEAPSTSMSRCSAGPSSRIDVSGSPGITWMMSARLASAVSGSMLCARRASNAGGSTRPPVCSPRAFRRSLARPISWNPAWMMSRVLTVCVLLASIPFQCTGVW